jgi:membrane-bound lytic murein transglycosylase A
MSAAPDLWRPDEDLSEALRVFQRTARRIADGVPSLRAARPASAALRAAARDSLGLQPSEALAFFSEHFRPRALASPGFLTGYYEPVVRGSLTRAPDFQEPILARPADLISFAPGEGPDGFDPMLAGARRRADGSLEPYPDRATIEEARAAPIVWLADAVEVFLIHVQGSARVVLPDGRQKRLVYDGRNGRPYTSIGRRLIEAGEIAEGEMSLARLKAWLRAHGLEPGQRGREWMRLNRSYIFFRLDDVGDPGEGPIGGAQVALTPLRSIAVDRTLWSYGLPFFIEADLPNGPFRRLMIAQDTGSAIVGEARFDLFFGTGDEAGARAGAVRHSCRAHALEPIEVSR